MLETLTEYHKAGIPLLRIRKGTKLPIDKEWNELGSEDFNDTIDRFRDDDYNVGGVIGNLIGKQSHAVPALFTEIVGQVCYYWYNGDFPSQKMTSGRPTSLPIYSISLGSEPTKVIYLPTRRCSIGISILLSIAVRRPSLRISKRTQARWTMNSSSPSSSWKHDSHDSSADVVTPKRY